MYEVVFWVAVVLVAGALLVRFQYWSLDRLHRDLERLAGDPRYRAEELARLSARLAAHPDDPEALRRRATVLSADGDESLDKAAAAWLAALEAAPDGGVAWAEYGDVLARQNRHAAAADAYERARANDPGGDRYGEYAQLSAREAILAGEFDRARRHIEAWRSAACANAARRRSAGGGDGQPLVGWRLGAWLGNGARFEPPPPGLAPDLYEALLRQAEGRPDEARDMVARLRSESPKDTARLLDELPELAVLNHLLAV